MTSFGIDFGTTNSVLAAADRAADVEVIPLDSPTIEWEELGFGRVLPTVIAEAGDGIDFGWRAKRSRSRLDAVKRLFALEDVVRVGAQTLKVEEAAAIFFRHIRQQALTQGKTLDQAVVTIPANSRGRARFRTRISAGIGGIDVLALVNEPTAAAIAFGRQIADGERVLVFDWGGGTLDVTILQQTGGVFIEEASKGIQKLGGIDIDTAFHVSLKSRLPASSTIDPFDLELAKVKLSAADEVALSLVGGGALAITRSEFEDAVRELIVRTREPIERCLADLGQPKIDHLVLVGGSSKIPAVRRFVREILRLDPMEGVDPMTAIAEGASIAAGILRGDITDYDFFVGTEHALGTVVHDDNDKPHFSVLIHRNTKLPASATDSYTPRFDDQESVLVRVIEGDPDAEFEHEDNVILKEWQVPLEPRPVSDAGFDITFLYDVDGILNVTAVDHKTGTTMLQQELTFGAGASQAELDEIRRRVDRTPTAQGVGVTPDRLAPSPAAASSTAASALSADVRAAVRQLKEKVYPFVDDATQQEIDAHVAALMANGDQASSGALQGILRDHSYLL